MFLHVNFDLTMINAKNVIQETKTETETFFQKFKGITLKWSKDIGLEEIISMQQ